MTYKIKVKEICMELHKEGVRPDMIIMADIDKDKKGWFKSLRNDAIVPPADCVVYPDNYEIVSQNP